MSHVVIARKARAHLRRVDPVMAKVMETVGPYRAGDRTGGTHFVALVRAIVFQQLSGKAATTIFNRFAALFPGNEPTPDGILALTDEQMRGAGLSRQKTGYLRDL